MRVEELSADIVLNGLTVRTKNSEELNLASAKIAPLWNKFFMEFVPSFEQDSKIYGVYSNYEYDATGEFDVTACTDFKNDRLSSVTIKKGKYLVFSAKGAMPQVVINTWGEIWNYFSVANKENLYQRAYLSDFEFYKNESEIEIFIGIK